MADDGDMKLVCKSEYPTYAKSQSNATALVSLFAPDVADEKRAPVSVTLVLDKSGSMAGSNIRLVKETCKFLLQQLGPRDSVSVVSYSTEARMDHKLVTASAANKESVSAAIDGIQAKGTTNLSAGLFMGLMQQIKNAAEPTPEQWAEGSSPKATIQSVFLFTDGQANHGLTSLNSISRALTNMLTANSKDKTPAPIKIHTFGFGADHDSTLLQGIANCANGTYYYIESSENIPEAFADALGGLLSVFAQNVELTISPVAPNTIKQVHTGYTKRTEGSSSVVALPDVFAEERKDIVVDLELPCASVAGPGGILEAKVTYINVVSGQMITRDATVTVNRAERVLHADMMADEEVVMHRTRLTVANRLQQAVQLADNGQYDEADNLLSEQVNVLNNLVIEDEDDDDSDSESTMGASQSRAVYSALRQDVHRVRGDMRHRSQWSAGGRHFALGSSNAHAYQRSTGSCYSARRAAPALGTQANPSLSPVAIAQGPLLGQLQGASNQSIPMPVVSENDAAAMISAPAPAPARRGLRGLWSRAMSSNSARSQMRMPTNAGPPPAMMHQNFSLPPTLMAHSRSVDAPSSPTAFRSGAPAPPGAAGPSFGDAGEQQDYGLRAPSVNPYANSQQRKMVQKSKSVMGPP